MIITAFIRPHVYTDPAFCIVDARSVFTTRRKTVVIQEDGTKTTFTHEFWKVKVTA